MLREQSNCPSLTIPRPPSAIPNSSVSVSVDSRLQNETRGSHRPLADRMTVRRRTRPSSKPTIEAVGSWTSRSSAPAKLRASRDVDCCGVVTLVSIDQSDLFPLGVSAISNAGPRLLRSCDGIDAPFLALIDGRHVGNSGTFGVTRSRGRPS